MKKKIKMPFKHMSFKKFSFGKVFAPFLLVLGFITGFLADRVSGIFFGANAAEAEQSKAEMKPSFKLLDPYEKMEPTHAKAQPPTVKIVKAKAKASAPAKKAVAKAKPAKKKVQKIARK